MSGHFKVVGECSAYGLEDATRLLGPLPAPWKLQLVPDDTNDLICQFFNTDTKETTIEDPRLPALASEWERFESPRTKDDPEYYQRFRNTVTGEVMNSDPRMLPDALRARGVALRTFQLI